MYKYNRLLAKSMATYKDNRALVRLRVFPGVIALLLVLDATGILGTEIIKTILRETGIHKFRQVQLAAV